MKLFVYSIDLYLLEIYHNSSNSGPILSLLAVMSIQWVSFIMAQWLARWHWLLLIAKFGNHQGWSELTRVQTNMLWSGKITRFWSILTTIPQALVQSDVILVRPEQDWLHSVRLWTHNLRQPMLVCKNASKERMCSLLFIYLTQAVGIGIID